ncbi:MmgE/Prp family protein [Agaricicola taiwanensis]|uniref:MmgE/Prp family protein n=1 Tax=Agaricicola taiwanensis TaxID=591372 RepID=A0A8J2YLU7_9RHOB|nr:MmgE/PrpD family protein [Agaricicola taiwanensis]GGE51717.1 MmgE/Prp family protein [Agaricicola taiwanensis]
MTRSHAHDLIAFVHQISLDDLPPAVVEQAKICLLEALGCGAFGSSQPWSRMLAEEVLSEQSRGVGTIIGRAEKVSAPGAALCNGTAIHGYELDDLIASSVVHPGAAVIPAALAAGEAVNATGARLIEAIVAGYEVMHRLGLAIGPEPFKRGFHVTSLTAPVACAVAAGIVMDLPLEKLLSSIGLCCSSASGIKSFATGNGGGMVKRLHLGRGAEAGVRMSQLAERGFLGPPFAIDSRFGLLEVFGGSGAMPEKLDSGLGGDWAISQTWFKVFPVCGWIQSAIQLLLEFRGETPLAASEIAKVRIGVSEYAVRNNSEAAPIDTMGAQYSIPYCAAVALTGNPRDPEMFAPSAVNRASTRELAARVEVVVDPRIEAVYPAQYGASASLTLTDGKTFEGIVLDCHGTPADPCTQEESRAKFKLLTRGRISEAQADALTEYVRDAADLSSVRLLTGTLSPARSHDPSFA